jgi:Na+-driven multidrug efflux pump
MGKQFNATVGSGIGLYIIGVPAGYFLCFELNYGLNGLWYGMILGFLLMVTYF